MATKQRKATAGKAKRAPVAAVAPRKARKARKAPAMVREGTSGPELGKAAGKGGKGAAVLPMPAAKRAAPAPVLGRNPALELSRELWVGLPGAMMLTESAVCSGRWTVSRRGLTGPTATKAMAFTNFAPFHKRQTEETGQSIGEHPLKWGKPGSEAETTVLATLAPAPGAWPFARTDVVVDDFDGGEELGLGGPFFRVYVSTDPETPGFRLVPDLIGLNLGDPANLWPAGVPGWLTDGHFVAVATAPDPVEVRARGVLGAVLGVLGADR